MSHPVSLHVHHCTSVPYKFFGRTAELHLLHEALASAAVSLVALIGPGGQGKTAIVQHWLSELSSRPSTADGVVLWSFYRGKDGDLCLRQLLADVTGAAVLPEASASYCVDKLLSLLRHDRWVVVLDGLEVVQYESGPWLGRLIHPELGRLLEEIAIEPSPSLIVVTTRFPLPDLERRRHARLVHLDSLDPASASGLLQSLGVKGSEADMQAAADFCGRHAKAVELLGTYLSHYHRGEAAGFRTLPEPNRSDLAGEEQQVARVLAAHQAALPAESQDIVALAIAFREPVTLARLIDYLRSDPVQVLLHRTWGRTYPAFTERPTGWLGSTVRRLMDLRLLEEVDAGTQGRVIDAHPLVRRGFEHSLGVAGRRQSATARAGFLQGRPDRRKSATLEEAREDVELFHAYCDAGLWEEADRVYLALDRPRYRFVAPALERDLLLRFFPDGDRRRSPHWPGFRHWRALAVCLEMLGQFEEALETYPEADAPLRGDALIASGRLRPLLDREQVPHPWQVLWRAYRCHALSLAGRFEEAVALAASLVPVDVYEWTHVFECLLRAGRLPTLDMQSFLHRPASAAGLRWADLARWRMRLDYLRVTDPAHAAMETEYPQLLDEYDRLGLPYERCLTRLGYARWLASRGFAERAVAVNELTLAISRRYGMRLIEADALSLAASLAGVMGAASLQSQLTEEAGSLWRDNACPGLPRP